MHDATDDGPMGPHLSEDAERRLVMSYLAERRGTEALDVQAVGARGRDRRLAAMHAAREEAHLATLAFLADLAPHAEDEDLHPSRLDPPSADLERALAQKRERRSEGKGGRAPPFGEAGE